MPTRRNWATKHSGCPSARSATSVASPTTWGSRDEDDGSAVRGPGRAGGGGPAALRRGGRVARDRAGIAGGARDIQHVGRAVPRRTAGGTGRDPPHAGDRAEHPAGAAGGLKRLIIREKWQCNERAAGV